MTYRFFVAIEGTVFLISEKEFQYTEASIDSVLRNIVIHYANDVEKSGGFWSGNSYIVVKQPKYLKFYYTKVMETN